jgi:outer membrane lipoprotein carrier protein
MKIFSFIVCMLLSHQIFAETDVEILAKKLQAMNQMSANFQQVVTSHKKKVSSSDGKMALQRPGKFRWQTTSPMPQIIVADGQKLWIYDVDLEQVTVKKQNKQLGSTAGLFLSNNIDNLLNDFDISQPTPNYFILKSKHPDNNIRRVDLSFNKNAQLSKMSMFDALAQRTDIFLIQININPIFKSDEFIFSPPEGVDTITE